MSPFNTFEQEAAAAAETFLCTVQILFSCLYPTLTNPTAITEGQCENRSVNRKLFLLLFPLFLHRSDSLKPPHYHNCPSNPVHPSIKNQSSAHLWTKPWETKALSPLVYCQYKIMSVSCSFINSGKKIDTSANKFHHTCPDLEVELVTNERETFLLKVYKPKKG